jgi:hypothetical protein
MNRHRVTSASYATSRSNTSIVAADLAVSWYPFSQCAANIQRKKLAANPAHLRCHRF